MSFADIAGVRLHYVLEGDSSRPVVVLINSLGTDLSMWDAQVPTLLESFRVLRYDTRGHGQSSLPATSPTMEVFADDIIALLDTLAIERVHLCGISLGGMTAMTVALQSVNRLCSLVLSNTAAKIGDAERWNQRIAEVQTHGLARVADTVVANWFTPAFQADNEEFKRLRSMLLQCPPLGYAQACGAIRDMDLRDRLSAIRIPTLVISGTDDRVTPPTDGRALQSAIPHAQFEQVSGAHLSNIEEPAAYNRLLLNFLRAQLNCINGDQTYGR